MRPIQTALSVIEALGRLQPAGVSELSRELDLPKSTVQRALKALRDAGWIEAVSGERGAWSLSLEAGLAVGRADYATRRLRGAAIPVMEELRGRTKESVYLAVRHRWRIALVERLDGINPVVHAWPLWQAGPMHSTSLGKAILAVMSDPEIEEYLEATLPGDEVRARATWDLIRSDVQDARRRGFATAFQTNWPDENGVGAAVRNNHGEPFAAISISAPVGRVSQQDCLEMGDMLVDAARRISLGLARR